MTADKILNLSFKLLKKVISYGLFLFIAALESSSEKEEEPTMTELTYGEKSPISGKYIIDK